MQARKDLEFFCWRNENKNDQNLKGRQADSKTKRNNKMGCYIGKMVLSKQDELFLLENTQFNKQQIAIWYSGFKKDCPSGMPLF